MMMEMFLDEQKARKYNINIIAVKDKGGVNIAISADTLLKQDATILVIGEHKAIKRWFNI